MNEIKLCPHCKKEIDSKATKCPHCHSDLRNWFRRHPIWTLILVIIFVPIFISGVANDYKEEPPVSQADKIASLKKDSFQHRAKDYVEGILKSPSTAKFNMFPTVTGDPNDLNKFTIDSSVDSQNGFGAMIHSTWSLTAHYTGPENDEDAIYAGGYWIIDEFYFDGKKIK